MTNKTFEFRKRTYAKGWAIMGTILIVFSIVLFWVAAKDVNNHVARTICVFLGLISGTGGISLIVSALKSHSETAEIVFRSNSITTPSRLNPAALKTIRYEDITSLQFFKASPLPITLLINYGHKQIVVNNECFSSDETFYSLASELSKRCNLTIADGLSS